jgi:hypothetical protein
VIYQLLYGASVRWRQALCSLVYTRKLADCIRLALA